MICPNCKSFHCVCAQWHRDSLTQHLVSALSQAVNRAVTLRAMGDTRHFAEIVSAEYKALKAEYVAEVPESPLAPVAVSAEDETRLHGMGVKWE